MGGFGQIGVHRVKVHTNLADCRQPIPLGSEYYTFLLGTVGRSVIESTNSAMESADSTANPLKIGLWVRALSLS